MYEMNRKTKEQNTSVSSDIDSPVLDEMQERSMSKRDYFLFWRRFLVMETILAILIWAYVTNKISWEGAVLFAQPLPSFIERIINYKPSFVGNGRYLVNPISIHFAEEH